MAKRLSQLIEFTVPRALLGIIVVLSLGSCVSREPEPVRVGILHSLSGAMASSESALVDAAMLAIEELNASGGVLGRRIEAVVADGKSDKSVFASEAERLIQEDGVAVLFGVWTSEHRKAVKNVVEANGSLLFYPLQYEGIEQSPNIVYLGATPNQQIIPAVEWSYRFLGDRMFLVGSDYVFPRVANAIIRDKLAAFGTEPVGEEYVPLGSMTFGPVIEKIRNARPDVILNSINGDGNQAFFRALAAAGISADDIPVMSFSIGETEVQALGAGDLSGHYSAWSYFQSVDTSANRKFLSAFRARFGADRVVGDPMEATYTGIHLWASAVLDSGSVAVDRVKPALFGKNFSVARGAVRVDPANQHLWQPARIGRLRSDGQFEIVWEKEFLAPVNYPVSRDRAEWEGLLADLYRSWGGNWGRQDSD
jgi:urea transport system substrate-binding protein